ncbi:MAG TPA: shikimate kinase [Acidimicrobiia bacterium]|nr:shikimate kinase [Acidimicrobiia bacterium]
MNAPTNAHLVLTGPMGSGKTTVGRLVAARLGRDFDDSDEWIDAKTGRSGADIARSAGVAHLHRLEAEHAMRALEAEVPAVVAMAAAAVDDPAVRRALRSAVVVVLVAPAGTLAARTAPSAHRRALGPDPAKATEALVARRRPLGEEVASGFVSTDGAIEAAVAEVLDIAGE